MKLTKTADPDKHGFIGYGIGIDARSQFPLPISEWSKNVVIFGVDNSSSSHPDNIKNDILVLGEGPIDESDDTKITTEVKYSVNITKSKKENLFTVQAIAFCMLMAWRSINSKLKTLK